MAIEKFIRGKVDNSRHAGRASEVRRLAETSHQVREQGFYEVTESPRQNVTLPPAEQIFPIRTAEPYRGRGGLNGRR